MADPRFLVENLFNLEQFPLHTITANEEVTGNEAFRVGAGRRVAGSISNFWTPTTSSQDAWVECLCNRPRAANMLVIDRDHNLATHTVRLQVSDDNFTTTTEIFSVVIPSDVHANSRLADTPGVKTTEGAFAISFPYHVGLYWRIFIDDMGGVLKPQVPGVYLGLSFQPTNPSPRPFDDEPTNLIYSSIVSDTLWTSSSRKNKRRETGFSMKMASDVEADRARYHFRALFGRGDLMWYVPDTDRAERAWLGEAPPGIDAAVFPTNYPFRVVELGLVEHNPKSD